MITSKKFLKLLQADSSQIEKIVNEMSQDDLKQLVKMMFNLFNEKRKNENMNL